LDHVNALIHHPNLSNLVDLYDPVKLLSKALHEPHTIFDGKRGIRHRAFTPDFDLRETADAYFLEGEFPGIKGRDALGLKWLDDATLQINGHIERSDLEQEWGVHVGSGAGLSQQDDSTNAPALPSNPSNNEWEEIAVEKSKGLVEKDRDPKEDGVRYWLNERRGGSYARTFSFPNKVDNDRIQARLGQGLLMIMVPKVDRSKLKSKEIHIIDTESARNANICQ